MHTHNETVVGAPAEPVFRAAADVERWPEILPHYRWVRFRRRDGFGRGRVEMAAHRYFGPLPYPTWWVSEMEADPEEHVVRYRHVDGITAGMDVEWRITPASGDDRTGGEADPGAEPPATRVVIVHEWEGPGWPVIGGFAARHVIGPHFVHVIADRTLAGIRAHAEERAAAGSRTAEGAGEGAP